MGKNIKICTQVLADHGQYTDLLIFPKLTFTEGVKMEVDPHDRANTETGRVDFKNKTDDTGYLVCRQNSVLRTRYSIKIFVKSFMPDPLFRFDSSGTRHTNPKNTESTLLEKSVKTPHFQKFNKHGISIAYRTEYLEENEQEILNNIDLGLHEYCSECNLETQTGGRPTVLRQLNLFDYLPAPDPHSGVRFS